MDSDLVVSKGHGNRIQVNKLLLKKVENLASIGLKNNEIASSLGMPYSTFYYKCKKFPTIKSAIERGRSHAIAKVTEKLQSLALSGNVRAIEVYLSQARRSMPINYSPETSDILKNKEKSAQDKMEAIIKDHVDGYVPLYVVSEFSKIMETLYVAQGVEEAKKKLKRVIEG